MTISHGLHGLSWVVYQLGFALGKPALSAQCSAHINGIPLTSMTTYQTSGFASILGSSPYAMVAQMVGPPYINLEAGDQLVCGLSAAAPGDMFSVAVYFNEVESLAQAAQMRKMGYA